MRKREIALMIRKKRKGEMEEEGDGAEECVREK